MISHSQPSHTDIIERLAPPLSDVEEADVFVVFWTFLKNKWSYRTTVAVKYVYGLMIRMMLITDA